MAAGEKVLEQDAAALSQELPSVNHEFWDFVEAIHALPGDVAAAAGQSAAPPWHNP